jgi:hypothetical protein
VGEFGNLPDCVVDCFDPAVVCTCVFLWVISDVCREYTSFLKRASQRVTRMYIQPQNLRYEPKLTNPMSSGVERKYLFANSGLLKARKTVNERKYPVFRPIV